MTEAEYIAILEAFNADGATVTWESVYVSHPTIPEDDVISIDPPVDEVVPPDQNFVMTVSTGPAVAGVAFPAVSRFGGLLQGVD